MTKADIEAKIKIIENSDEGRNPERKKNAIKQLQEALKQFNPTKTNTTNL